MPKILILLIFFVSTVSAEVSLPWTWSSYVGTSQWRVDVTEDETACGGETTTAPYTISIIHNLTSAKINNFVHGDVSGVFEGNILHIPGRTIPDGSGTSVLSSYDITFSQDCSSFAAKYYWDYSDSYGSCSGSTTLRGTAYKGCPAPTVVPVIPPVEPPSTEYLRSEISNARHDLNEGSALRSLMNIHQQEIDFKRNSEFADSVKELEELIKDEKNKLNQLESKIEAEYKVILDKDPSNFWANWDVAELKKQQGKYDEYFAYFDRDASNKNIFENTKNELKKKVAEDFGFSEFPTVDKSNIVRTLGDDMNRWQGGTIYDVNLPKEAAADKKTWSMKLYNILYSDSYSIVNELVGLPGDK